MIPRQPGPLHVGLTGLMASGKGEAARLMRDRGYAYISLSDVVREHALAGLTPEAGKITRSDLQDTGDRLRRESGAGVLADKVCVKIRSILPGRWVIDGIRNPAEVERLRTLHPFHLIAIIAPRNAVLRRLRERNRGTDHLPDCELEKMVDREWGDKETSEGQQVGLCIAMADHRVKNDGTLEGFRQRMRKILKKIEESDG